MRGLSAIWGLIAVQGIIAVQRLSAVWGFSAIRGISAIRGLSAVQGLCPEAVLSGYSIKIAGNPTLAVPGVKKNLFRILYCFCKQM